MDTLFVSSHFIYILEIKNVSGSIWYEEDKYQFLRKKWNGEVESFQSPFDQVQRHAEWIERIVERLGLSLPIHKVVVIAEPSTIIDAVPNEFVIFYAIGLPAEIKKLLLKYGNFSLSGAHYEMLANQLLSLHKPTIYAPKFEVPPLRKGAICECRRGMTYKAHTFKCSCGKSSKSYLYHGLHDNRVLFSVWITNPEFRDFFLIENGDTANKLLKRMEFYYEGSNKGRRYLIPKDVWRIN